VAARDEGGVAEGGVGGLTVATPGRWRRGRGYAQLTVAGRDGGVGKARRVRTTDGGWGDGRRRRGGAQRTVPPLADHREKGPALERGLLILPPCCFLAGADAGRAWAFLALSHLELDLLALIERRVPLHPYLGMMDEQIVAAIIRRDEPEPLVRVEPFHCTLCHVFFSLDPFGPIDYSLWYCTRGRLRGRKAYSFTKRSGYHTRVPLSTR